MRLHSLMILSVATGLTIITVANHGLWAQARLPAYAIVEVEVTEEEAYAREFLPLVADALRSQGAKYLARGGRSINLAGGPAKRGSIIAFDSFDQAQAAFASPAYKQARAIGDKYAKIRVYIMEGSPQ